MRVIAPTSDSVFQRWKMERKSTFAMKQGKEHLRNLLFNLQRRLQMHSWEDWYNVTLKDFSEVKRNLKDFKHCYITALLSAFPGFPFFQV